MGFEIAEQLGWRAPRHTVVCMASGSLLTKIHKAYKEFTTLGLIEKTHYPHPRRTGHRLLADLVRP